ncbi:hypothetical protein V1521DRAFT_391065 [Lipomyces starkeyi]
MDGVGFTCMTHSSNVQLCDVCTTTQAVLTQSLQHQTQGITSFQLPEGPMPVAKRLKFDTTGMMKESIKTAFSCVMTEYGGCVMCAVTRRTIHHSNYDAPTILNDHDFTITTFKVFNEQLYFGHDGVCHGCGLNLRILNGLPEHVPSRACVYTAISRLVCYELFMNGRLSACIKDIDRGFLDTGDIKSFAKWLNVHPLGMSVNNLTAIVYNWSTLGLVEDAIHSPMAVHGDRGHVTDDVVAQTVMAISQRQTAEPHILQQGRPNGEVQRGPSQIHGGTQGENIAEAWLQFIMRIQNEFHGCPICAVSEVPQQHESSSSFNQVLRAHGYNDTNDFMHFEMKTRFKVEEARAICLSCSLPRRLVRRMKDHQGSGCFIPRVARALCYVAWKNGTVSHYIPSRYGSNIQANGEEWFCKWLTGVSVEHHGSGVYNMTEFVVNMMRSTIRYGRGASRVG